MHTMKRGKMPEYGRTKCMYTGGCINSGGDRGKRDKGDGGVKRKHEGRRIANFLFHRKNILRRLTTDKLPMQQLHFRHQFKETHVCIGIAPKRTYTSKSSPPLSSTHGLGVVVLCTQALLLLVSPHRIVEPYSSSSITHPWYSIDCLRMHLKPPRVI